MARITPRPNGVTASCPRFGTQENIAVRGKVGGWSRQSVSNLRRKFYSVDGDELTGMAFAHSFTIRDLPPTHADWVRTVQNFKKRMIRAGAIRGQWLTEWQLRGVPHLHGILYFPDGTQGVDKMVLKHWLSAAAEWAPQEGGQDVKPVWGLVGWLQYQAKHSSRGVKHYQRAHVPEAWENVTGRMWAFWGDWPMREEIVDVSLYTFHRFRRLMQKWLIGKAREELWAAEMARWGPRREEIDEKDAYYRELAALRRLQFLKGILKVTEKNLSTVRGVSEFCPEHVSRRLLRAAELRQA